MSDGLNGVDVEEKGITREFLKVFLIDFLNDLSKSAEDDDLEEFIEGWLNKYEL